jgi:hypothetical protein
MSSRNPRKEKRAMKRVQETAIEKRWRSGAEMEPWEGRRR